jgi:hypothetical protein
MSDIKLKPIAEGIIDDFINKKSKYDYRKLDYERVTSILQSRVKPIKIKHWGVYSVRFGKKFVAVPEIKLENDSFEYVIKRPNSVRESGDKIFSIDLSIQPDNIKLHMGGNNLNYYNIYYELIDDISDSLESTLKNASNYYDSLDDSIISKIVKVFRMKLQDAVEGRDKSIESYDNFKV